MGYLNEGREIRGLTGSYTIERALPKSGFGAAFVARDERGEHVLLKEAHLGEADAFKRVDALGREARATMHLACARVPKHLEIFALDELGPRPASELTQTRDEARGGTPPSLVLARAFVPGATIAEALRDKRRFTAIELERIFRDLLETRRYLDALLPPLTHGDVSPSNVVVDEDGAAWLVDFGAVAEEPAPSPSAAVGTSGFMPPEQLAGRAAPASDLFAMAMTVLTAASHRSAHDLPIDPRTMKVAVSQIVTGLPGRFAQALALCLEPSLSSRARSAAEALHVLDGGSRAVYRARAFASDRALRVGRPGFVLGALLASFLPGALLTIPLARWAKPRATPIEHPTFVPMPLVVSPPIAVADPPVAAVDPPADPPAAPTPALPTLTWSGKVERATGELPAGELPAGELRAGEACSLMALGNPSDTSASCSLTLRCGDRVVLADAGGACKFGETLLGDGSSVYQLAISKSRPEGAAGQDIALDAKTGRLRVSSVSATGEVLEEVRVRLDPKSAPAVSGLASSRLFVKRSRFTGTLVRAVGLTGPKKGDTCSYDLSPIEDVDAMEMDGQDCRAVVRCGGEVLYDGYGSCTLDDHGAPVDMTDGEPTPTDGDPTLMVIGHELTIGDITPDRTVDALVYLDRDPHPSGGE